MEKRNVPEIRFEGFTDDWEKCKIGDIAEIVSGGTPDTNNPNYWDGDINWYAPAEIVDQIYVSKSERKITELGLQKSSAKMLANLNLMMPNRDEQERIAAHFKSLDKLIIFYQRKYEKLKLFKEAMLEKMFPKNGEKVPEIRFKGFTDDWQQCKLDVIADVRDGTHDSPQYTVDGHPFVTSKNVKDGYINYNDIQFISEKDYKEVNKRSKVDKNDILMGMIGTIGNIALVREIPDFAIKNVALIKDTGNIFYLYLYHCLQSASIVNQLNGNLDGGTQKFIALNKVRELDIPIPNVDEQHKIGDCMEYFDNLIILHQHKYEKLKLFKEAMLNKMFI